ncbi:hypothetical protein SDC9_84488 [bioreactor metagenome]|uniref:Uncharacterized protein n=1 Tax=bioreactor metagenome TaxID=1076179 RepID=A0A644ZAY7_9ZZZZ
MIVITVPATPTVYVQRHLIRPSGYACARVAVQIGGSAAHCGEGIGSRTDHGDGIGIRACSALGKHGAVLRAKLNLLCCGNAVERDLEALTAIFCPLPGIDGKRVGSPERKLGSSGGRRIHRGLEPDNAFRRRFGGGRGRLLLCNAKRLQQGFGCSAGGLIGKDYR